MIVRVEGNQGIVVGYTSNNTWFCLMDGLLTLKRIEPFQMIIIDNHIPNDWIVDSYYFSSLNDVPEWLDADYNDYVFFAHPKMIKPHYLVELSYHNVVPTKDYPFENYVIQKVANDIRVFHGIPKVEVPYIEEYELAFMSPEAKRQSRLNAELEEYLRIGEEIEKEK